MISTDKDPNFKFTTAFPGHCEMSRRFVNNSTVKLQRGVKVGTPSVIRLKSCSSVVWRVNAAICIWTGWAELENFYSAFRREERSWWLVVYRLSRYITASELNEL